MSLSGEVQITILDGGGSSVVVPSSSVHVVMGCATSGTDNAIVATRSPATLVSEFTSGPLVEAAAMACDAGATCLCVKLPTVTAGLVRGSDRDPLTVSDVSSASAAVVETSAAHGLTDGAIVTIASVGGVTGANGTFKATVLSATTFSIPYDSTLDTYTSGGTVQFTGVVATMTGTCAPTLTGTPVDDFYCEITIKTGGTIGTAGILFTVSLDAGRQTGPTIALGTATSYAIPGTGVTVVFVSTKTLVAGDIIRFSTIAPLWNDAGLLAAKNALLASGYAVTGWGGGVHVVGPATGSDASTLQTYLEALATNYVYTRAMLDGRDVEPPAAWGGMGDETEAEWMTAIEADFSAVDAKRALCGAGHYNMTSSIASSVAGVPRYRRSLTWAFAARQVTLAPQRHAGRVRDGALSQIILDPTNDPSDGFVYHDERINPGLDRLTGGAGRFCSARTRIGYPGIYIVNPLLLAAPGSDYTFWPRGAVMDIACSIVHQTGELYINDDVRTLPAAKGGTINENDARTIEQSIGGELKDQMVSTTMISGMSVSVDRTNNVQADDFVNIAVQIEGKGYVLQENVSIGYAHASAST